MAIIRKATIAGSVQGFALDSLEDSAIAKLQWDIPGTILKLGSRSTVTKIDLNGVPVVIKQYKALALRRRIRYALTRSRARQSWETGQAMADLGLPIVRPLGFFEETRFQIPHRAILITPFQQGTSLDLYHDPAKVAAGLRAVFQTMATNQITHGDLKATNIIIDDDGNPHFLDNDAARLHRSRRRFQTARKRDEKTFLNNWQSSPKLHELFRDIFN